MIYGIYFTEDLAKTLGCSRRDIRHIARALNIGEKKGSNTWTFTEKDVNRLKAFKGGEEK
jgi:hypothetical protein